MVPMNLQQLQETIRTRLQLQSTGYLQLQEESRKKMQITKRYITFQLSGASNNQF